MGLIGAQPQKTESPRWHSPASAIIPPLPITFGVFPTKLQAKRTGPLLWARIFFPIYLYLGPIHPHVLFEKLAYALGFRLATLRQAIRSRNFRKRPLR